MIERVNHHQRLGDYMKFHAWNLLDMSSTAFRLELRLDIHDRLMDIICRFPVMNELVRSPTRYWSETVSNDNGSAGVYSCPCDYFKLFSALLRNDGTLQAISSIDQLFSTPLAELQVQRHERAHI